MYLLFYHNTKVDITLVTAHVSFNSVLAHISELISTKNLTWRLMEPSGEWIDGTTFDDLSLNYPTLQGVRK